MSPAQFLEKRLRHAQVQRLILLWFCVILFGLSMYLFAQSHSTQVQACKRGTASAARLADLSRRIGALEDSRFFERRARLDCGRAVSWF